MIVFEVKVYYKSNKVGGTPDAHFRISASDDAQARAKAMNLDNQGWEKIQRPAKSRVNFCEIRAIAELDSIEKVK